MTSPLSISLKKTNEEFCDITYDLNNSQNINPLDSKPNSNETSSNNTISRSLSENKAESKTSLLICQITSFDEAKIYKFITNSTDMLLNFDFYPKNGKKFWFIWHRFRLKKKECTLIFFIYDKRYLFACYF